MKPSLALFASTVLFAFQLNAGWLYSEYSGAYREWPNSSESMAETSHELPVYRTWPNKPYEVLGSLRHEDPRKEWRTGEIKDVARQAKKKGGTAIIIRYGSEDGVAAATGFSGDAAFVRAQPTALVIRFLSEAEIAERDRRRNALFKDVIRRNPAVGFSEDTGIIAIKYLLQSGIKETAPDFESRFTELMTRVRPTTVGDVSGEWLFKASLKTSSLTASDERSYFGVAAVKHDRTNFVVVSRQGKVEFNFSGSVQGGKVDGQLGIANLSSKADGVLLDQKISITFQSLTGSGTAQGTVVLQRAEIPAPAPITSKDSLKTL